MAKRRTAGRVELDLKRDLDVLALLRAVRLKELPWLKPAKRPNEPIRNHTQLCVVVSRHCVVVPAGILDRFLDLVEGTLKALEILTGL